MNKSELSRHLAAIGARGGKAGRGKAKARDPQKMRAAANKRWAEWRRNMRRNP